MMSIQSCVSSRRVCQRAAYLVVKMPRLVVCLRAPPVEDGPEVYFHQLPLGAMTDVAEYPGKHTHVVACYKVKTAAVDNDECKWC